MDWISVDDRLPEENILVLARVEYTILHLPSVEQTVVTGWRIMDCEGEIVWAFGNDRLVWDYEYNIHGDPIVVEWMPLPEPPK